MREFKKEDYKKNPNGKRMSQKDRLIKYLFEQGGITREPAFNLIGIAELSARVVEINRQKLRIGMQKVKVNTIFAGDIDVTQYYLL